MQNLKKENNKSILINLMVNLYLVYVPNAELSFSKIESTYLLGNTSTIYSIIFYKIKYKKGIIFVKNISMNSWTSLHIAFKVLGAFCVGMDRIGVNLL